MELNQTQRLFAFLLTKRSSSRLNERFLDLDQVENFTLPHTAGEI